MTVRLRQPLQVLTCGTAIAQDNWHLQSRRHRDQQWRAAYWPEANVWKGESVYTPATIRLSESPQALLNSDPVGETYTLLRMNWHYVSKDVNLNIYNFRRTSIFDISFYFTYMSVFDYVMASFVSGWHE